MEAFHRDRIVIHTSESAAIFTIRFAESSHSLPPCQRVSQEPDVRKQFVELRPALSGQAMKDILQVGEWVDVVPLAAAYHAVQH